MFLLWSTLQLFNEINSRDIEKINIFRGMFDSWIFIIVMVCTVAFQIIIVELLGTFASTVPQSWQLWILSILIGAVGMPVAVVLKCIPVETGSFKQHDDYEALPSGPEQAWGERFLMPWFWALVRNSEGELGRVVRRASHVFEGKQNKGEYITPCLSSLFCFPSKTCKISTILISPPPPSLQSSETGTRKINPTLHHTILVFSYFPLFSLKYMWNMSIKILSQHPLK